MARNNELILCFLYFVMCVGCGIYLFDADFDEVGKINDEKDHAMMLPGDDDLKNKETKVMHRRKNLFKMAGQALAQNNVKENPNTAVSLPHKHQCLVEKYCKITSSADYISPYAIPVPNLLYVIDILEKLCLKMIPDRNGRDVEQETDVVEGEMREVLPGIVMRVTRPYPNSPFLISEGNSGTQLRPEVNVDDSSADDNPRKNVKTYDVEIVQNCISKFIPQQHRSNGFANFKMLLDYLPSYVNHVEQFVNVAEDFPFIYELMKIGKKQILKSSNVKESE